MGSILLSLAICAGGVFLPNAPTKSEFDFHPIELKIVERTNAQRARYGLPPLKIDRSLMRWSREHATWMTRTYSLTHTSRSVGENIAMGQQSSAEAVQAWMNSPGHRANILNPSYTRIGAAAFVARDGTIFWCQQFLR